MTNNASIPLLLTRPRHDSEAYWRSLPDTLRQILRPVYCPLIDIEPTNMAADIAQDAVAIFSSRNGVAHAPRGAGRRAFCVGDATTAAAKAAGWHAHKAGNTADELVRTLFDRTDLQNLVHLGGEDTRGDIALRLNAVHIPLYRQIYPAVPDDAQAIIASSQPFLVPLFSPNTARRFASLVPQDNAANVAAFSAAVADALGNTSVQSCRVCSAPNANAMTEALEKLCQKLPLG